MRYDRTSGGDDDVQWTGDEPRQGDEVKMRSLGVRVYATQIPDRILCSRHIEKLLTILL